MSAALTAIDSTPLYLCVDGELRGVAVASQRVRHVVGGLSNAPERQYIKHNQHDTRVYTV